MMRHAWPLMRRSRSTAAGCSCSRGLRALKALTGAALLPFCLGFTWQAGSQAAALTYRPAAPYYFLLGAIAYLVLHVLFRKPVFTYVVGHELTHALFALLFGGSVKSFHASDRGGRVTITKSNAVITLAPYCFPLYTIGALLLLGLARTVEFDGGEGWLLVLAGGTYCFHLVLTVTFLGIDQDDIREQGRLFSYALIYLFNILFAGFLLTVILSLPRDYLGFLSGGIIKGMTVTTLITGGIRQLFASSS